jgi:putative nucleotidyltransferase with HDIG domain
MTPTPSEARRLLFVLNAPERLVIHADLVHEAALQLIAGLSGIGLHFDRNTVEVGALLHDIGKIQHEIELDEPGSNHEAAGERMLLAQNWDPSIARICRTHATWQDPGCSLEENLVALADKLWKGKRVDVLEESVISRFATLENRDFWQLYLPLMAIFESVASLGPSRLARSFKEPSVG